MDASEFKKMFLPLNKRMYWAAWQLTGNAQEAEDLVQEAYLKLWTKRDQLHDIENTGA
jgi:RNA polymerase sigma-70 factor (ECF subfamily)